jgi:hypothetical protein
MPLPARRSDNAVWRGAALHRYEALFLPAFFDTLWASGEPKLEFLKGALLDRNRIANGVRWTQRRGRLNRCAVAGKYNEFFPFCFPPLYNDARDGPVSKDPFGPYYSPNKYRYNETDIGAGFDDGGFIVSFPFDLAESKQKLAELKSDRWVDEHTQERPGPPLISVAQRLQRAMRCSSGHCILSKCSRVARRSPCCPKPACLPVWNVLACSLPARAATTALAPNARGGQSAQWLRIDFATYNPSASLITQVMPSLGLCRGLPARVDAGDRRA